MKDDDLFQLTMVMKMKSSRSILNEVKKIFYYHYPKKSFNNIKRCYILITKLFEGKFPGYKACNTEYHDLNHTLDALLASARLIDGYNRKERELPLHLVINILQAALLHDTGYIQEEWDNAGTGAKYTKTHVGRGIAFVVKQNRKFLIDQDDVATISKLIRCTGLNMNIDEIPFGTEQERIAGSILGTADILGQMSDRVYLEKLLFLYYEFREAGIPGFNTEFDIIKKTIDFYKVTEKRLNNDFGRIYDYASVHFSQCKNIDRNLYIEAINKNIQYVNTIIEDDSTNFRHKLKRGDWLSKNIEVDRREVVL
ncbi:MAG: hypothetical protein SVR08_15065 [Spirochaetota bacterium]|nr:hypothetical protein [Spirochaetota bacterium]